MAYDFPRRTFEPDASDLDAKACKTTTTPEQAAEALRQFVAQSRRQFETDPAWVAARADAQAMGLKPEKVREFKRRHRLPLDQRLSPDACALLLQEIEADQRTAKGKQLARAHALELIAQRATPEAAAAVAAVLPCGAAGPWVSGYEAEAYLLNRVQALTGKRYATAGAACRKAAALAPAAASAAEALKAGRFDRFRRDLFWGVILRLDQLQGPPPADWEAFYSWCQLRAYEGHHTGPSLGDLLAGRVSSGDARGLLQLPKSGPLDPAAIRSAYRAHARHHHPDAGGDRHRFERLSEARDRLLLEVA
ncbi:J domain-containing protein [Cyanobium sp. BA20m-p-22]|uniref:J domain-containing protein n=1 Tax=Cyanobium sp. BA20m-p-22 TaxID=2823704 RepID=UPI0020CD1813|nr:J domain-containing protein [Cyanobium sp. BA20m-p-22]MCP9910250.1 J domain-containing protein [Cyanobium sp. BA20m-p-22]